MLYFNSSGWYGGVVQDSNGWFFDWHAQIFVVYQASFFY